MTSPFPYYLPPSQRHPLLNQLPVTLSSIYTINLRVFMDEETLVNYVVFKHQLNLYNKLVKLDMNFVTKNYMV